ncbi:MAG: phosphohistidine phosphatase SixA [Cyanobacteria bacterium P01_A01_bin.83]
MEIYLIRHGIAVTKGIYSQDAERPLTDKGIAKTKLVAQRLFDIGVTFEYLLSSPLVRACQTAEILQRAGLSKEITISKFLSPNGNIHNGLQWLFNNYNEDYKIALVGHQPDLGNWASMLIFGDIKEQLIVKKAGIIGINITNKSEPIGNSELFLLTSPKWFIC